MPIMRLSDKKTLARGYRFPHCGELAKGGPKPARGSGKELPYWRFIPRMPGAKEAFESVYGTEVKELPDAALAYPTIEQTFESWIECREPGEGGKFWWRSDGERSVARWMPEKNTYTFRTDEQLPHADLPNHKWERNVGRLYIRLIGLAKAGFSQPVLVRTGGINDIARIAQFLYGLWEEQVTYHGEDATLEHYLVTLWRFEVKRTDPNKGGRYDHWDIGIARSPLYMQSALQGAQDRAVAQLASGNIRLLDIDTGEFVDGHADYPELDEPEPHHEQTEQDLEEPSVVGGQGAGLPPAPEPPAEEKPKPKRTRARKPKPEPEPEPEPEGALFEAMAQNGLDYDANRKPASLSGININAWRGASSKLAEDCPVSFAKDGKPNLPRILAVAGGLGYEKVQDGNLDEVMEKLREFDAQAQVPF